MALTFTADNFGVVGAQRQWQGTVTFDASYPTGGEAVLPADFGGLVQIDTVIIGQTNVAGVDAVWDATNSKVILYDEDNTSGVAAQAANASDQSATIVTAIVYGK